MQETHKESALNQQCLDWFKQWNSFLATENYNQGLLSVLSVITKMRTSQVIDVYTQEVGAKILAQQFVRYYTLFVGRADLALVNKHYIALCHLKGILGPLMDAAGLGGIHPTKLWEKFSKSENPEQLELVRSLALVTLSSVHLFPGNKIKDIDPQLIAPLAYNCLAQRYVLDSQQNANKKALISICDFYEDMKFAGYNDTAISLAWMYCSYMYWEKKHSLKQSINRVCLRWLTEKRLTDKKPHPPRPVKQKPVIVIFAEVFSDNHALFRCHGASAAALKNRFQTVLITDLTKLSPATRGLFSKTIQIDSGPKCVEKNLKTLRKLHPDMIYYPSVGMNRNAVYLCNLRLAPIQFLSMGHPASTFSKEMDYVIVNNDLRPDPACFSEKIIHRRQSAGYQPYPGWSRQLIGKSGLPATKKLRVGIIGYLPKVTSEFLQVCVALDKNCPNDLEFHFFTHTNGIDFHGFRSAIKAILPSAVIQLPKLYGSYMNNVHAMDLILSTFPFGNTNGTVDTLLARKPVIALDGPEPHAKTDGRLLKKAGAPPEMLVTSPQDYYKTAMDWLSHPKKLTQMAEALEKLDIEGTFFSSDEKSDFDEIVSLVYDTHAKIQADPRREFEYGDLLTLKGALEPETTA